MLYKNIDSVFIRIDISEEHIVPSKWCSMVNDLDIEDKLDEVRYLISEELAKKGFYGVKS